MYKVYISYRLIQEKNIGVYIANFLRAGAYPALPCDRTTALVHCLQGSIVLYAWFNEDIR